MEKRILLASGDPSFRTLLTLTFGDGFSFLQASNGNAALRLALHKKPDLVILDTTTPDLDGDLTCSTLKRNSTTKNTPVIIISASLLEKDKEGGIEIGADACFAKPFSPTELLEKVFEKLDAQPHLSPMGEISKRVAALNTRVFQQMELAHAVCR